MTPLRTSPRPRAALAALLTALLVAACAGGGADGRSGGAGTVPEPVRRSVSSADPLGAIDVPEPTEGEERVRIGAAATRALEAFIAGDRVVIGEQTTVDLTRTPFLAMAAFAVNPDDVERREERDDARGLLIITLTNRTGVKTHLPSLPRVEIGGMLFVGVEQLVLRYALLDDVRRPIRLRAVAERNAVYREAASGRRERGGRVLVEMSVEGTGDAARFVENVRVDP